MLNEKLELDEFEKKRELLGNELLKKISDKKSEIGKNEVIIENIQNKIQKTEKNIYEIIDDDLRRRSDFLSDIRKRYRCFC